MRPERHAFVRLSGRPDPRVCGGDLAEVEAWREAGLPFVVASAWRDDPPDCVRLGLATPDKRRIGFRARMDRIGSVLPPPSLAEATAHAPADWLPTIAVVAKTCGEADIAASVFGSLAWTCRSGRPYLRQGSDLDLLLAPSARSGPERVRGALARLLGAAGDHPRLDGELRLADGSAVNLREFADAPCECLVKAHGGARLVPAGAVAARIGAGA